MKLLIRTITIATIGFFMIVICLHGMIVETVKHEMDVATVTALNRTIDAWEENRAMIEDGKTSGLQFVSDEDYYWFFYDSLVIQLNGNIDVLVMANNVDLETGVLDVDTTVTYMGLDGKERNYTLHSDTYGRIREVVDNSPERQELIKELRSIPQGAIVNWAGHEWKNAGVNGDNIILIDNGSSGTASYGPGTSYKDSDLRTIRPSGMTEEYMNQINIISLAGMGTNETYVTNGLEFFVPSKQELESAFISDRCWTRTVASTEDRTMLLGDGSTASVDSNISVKIAVPLSVYKINGLNREGGYTIY